jgi:outer membrane protein
MRTLIAITIAAAGLAASSNHAVHAQSLPDALAQAYLFNPTLKAARAQLRATDENVARQKSGFRPTIIGEATAAYQNVETNVPGVGGDSYPRSASVTLSQPIFRGFRTINAVKGAQAQVEAGREDLRLSEQNVLLDAVTFYVNVVRDEAILKLRENNLRVLNEQLRATQDRFQVGEVTKTDVAQARARVSGATSAISAAKANLQASRAAYAQIIGSPPRALRDPGPSRVVPRNIAEAMQIGEGENPQILGAIFRERAQDHLIKQTQGELLPSVDLQATYSHNEDSSGAADHQDVTTVTGVVTVPIYQAGEVDARIRQNVETRSQLRHLINESREAVRANVTSTWGAFVAARAQIVSDQAQVEANNVALAGVREEEKVGQRTVLDVLDAEQELLNAQVALATSRRDLVVASYQVLAAIGRLSAGNIGLGVEQYDPSRHYDEVKNKVIGWSTSLEESETEPLVAPVTVKGRTPGQESGGPAYSDDIFDSIFR